MSMYMCDYCGRLFREPSEGVDRIDCGNGIFEREGYSKCPFCGEEKYTEVVECPVCGSWMPDGWNICDSCCKKLANHFSAFIGGLEPAELDQLDDWLDGASVKDCNNFK